MSEIRAVHASSALNSLKDLLHPRARQVVVRSGKAVFQHVMSVALKQGEDVQAGLGLEPDHALPARAALHRLKEHEAHPLTLARGRHVKVIEPRRRPSSTHPARHTHQGSLGVSRRDGVLVRQPLRPIDAVDVRSLRALSRRVLAVGAFQDAVSTEVDGASHLLALQRPQGQLIHGPRRRWGPSAPPDGQGSSLRQGLSASTTRRPR